jgi:hypothetical protein
MARKTLTQHVTAGNISTSLTAEQLIPCILHMKMRMMEKVLHSLVNSALDRYGDSQLDRTKQNLLSDEIELCMKGKVLGDSNKGIISQWKFGWTKENSMEKICMMGTISQKILLNMRQLMRK